MILAVPGFTGYFASEAGDIFTSRLGGLHRLSTRPHKGYLYVWVRDGVGRGARRHMPVHRLVLLAFDGPPPTDKHQCRHLDGNPLNNEISNLAWGTPSENARDAIFHGTSSSLKIGEQSNAAKLNDTAVVDILMRVREGEVQSAIAMEYGISQRHVSDIKLGRTRRDITAPSRG